MKFQKYNGAGNDFIIINNMEEHIPAEKLPAIARKLCHRHMSLGADGFMVVEKSGAADYKMLFFNSDGSVGEMCGNGARCICRYGYENGLAGEVQRVETASGIVTGRRIAPRVYTVRLTEPTVIKPAVSAEVRGKAYTCGYVELGTPGLPHGVVHIPNLRDVPDAELFQLGRALRYHPVFPKGANITFYDFAGENHVFERTYERGVEDFTYACGTGTAAVAIILALAGKAADAGFTADMPGGRLGVDITRDGNSIEAVYLTGPTNTVAAGEILDEELEV